MLHAPRLVKTYRAPAGAQLRVLDAVDVDVKDGDPSSSRVRRAPARVRCSTCSACSRTRQRGDLVRCRARERAGALGGQPARGRFVGFVFQSFLLLPSLTALDNVVLAAR